MRAQVILAICLIAVVSFPVWSMADDVTIPITQYEPQQSTTGPEPPPGVLAKVPDLRPLGIFRTAPPGLIAPDT